MSTIADTTFRITNTNLYIPIVTLSSKDNVKLVKLLEEGLKRPIYWNEHQINIETRDLDNNNFTRFPLDASLQGVRRLSVLDQSINNLIKQYGEIRKAATVQGDDCKTGCLLDNQYFKDHYQLTLVNRKN